MGVIRHDFGLTPRRLARRFRLALGLDALHEANIGANPLPYLERASEKIDRLERIVFEAAQAAASSANESTSGEMILVDEAEYRRLLRCLAIIEAGLEVLG